MGVTALFAREDDEPAGGDRLPAPGSGLDAEPDGERLREVARRHQLLLDSLSEGVIAADGAGRVVRANAAACQLLGYSEDELIGRSGHEVMHHSHRDGTPLPVEECRVLELAARGIFGQGEDLYWRRDGSPFEIDYRVAPIIDHGEPAGMVVVFRDISERRRIERALEQTQRLYRLAVDNSADMIALIGPGGRIVFASKAHERVLGYAPEELIGRPIFEFIDPADVEQAQAAVEAAIAAGEAAAPVVLSKRLRRRDETFVDVEGVVAIVHGAEGDEPLVLAVNRDVSARNELEQQLRHAQKMEAVGRLAAGVAHDFNNLLTAIFGYTALALGEVGSDQTELRRHLDALQGVADSARTLTRQLLTFSRPQPLETRPISLSAAVDSSLPLLEHLVGENVEMRTRLQPVPECEADPGAIEQVLANLIVNARDALPDGGSIEIDCNLARLGPNDGPRLGLDPGDHVCLRVVDSGSGIAPETLDHIFEPFFTTKPDGVGTGLGLATVHGIIRQLGGAIDVTSTLGHGTSFTIYLPVADEGIE